MGKWEKYLTAGRTSGQLGDASISKHPMYRTWYTMIMRALMHETGDVCKAWLHGDGADHPLTIFTRDLGPKPAGHSLARFDKDLPYRPDNVGWLTKGEAYKKANARRKRFGQATAFTADQVRAIKLLLRNSKRKTAARDLAFLDIGIDAMLRVSDILSLRVTDIQDSSGGIVSTFTVRQIKTSNTVKCNLSERTREDIAAYLATFKISGYSGVLFPISSRQAQRIVKIAAASIGLATDTYSPHSLRRTKAEIIYAETHDIESVRILLGHASVAATSAYLGIGAADASALANAVDI